MVTVQICENISSWSNLLILGLWVLNIFFPAQGVVLNGNVVEDEAVELRGCTGRRPSGVILNDPLDMRMILRRVVMMIFIFWVKSSSIIEAQWFLDVRIVLRGVAVTVFIFLVVSYSMIPWILEWFWEWFSVTSSSRNPWLSEWWHSIYHQETLQCDQRLNCRLWFSLLSVAMKPHTQLHPDEPTGYPIGFLINNFRIHPAILQLYHANMTLPSTSSAVIKVLGRILCSESAHSKLHRHNETLEFKIIDTMSHWWHFTLSLSESAVGNIEMKTLSTISNCWN